ncbi:riboflavin kinase [Coniothyrium glycines]
MGRPSGPRAPIAGPDTPEAPFPLKLRGPVITGFGRGSKELGIPTANIPLTPHTNTTIAPLPSGVYFGFCALDTSSIPPFPSPSPSSPILPPFPPSSTVYPTVLSIGYNPYYKNTTRSVEIHILHTFPRDFYGAVLSLVVLGFIRPEYDYVSKEALVRDIREDIRVAERSLARDQYQVWKGDAWLKGEGVEGEEENGQGGNGNVDYASVGQKDGVVISEAS